MSVPLKITGHLLLIILLTAVTQVGGVIWLICLGLMSGLKVGKWYCRVGLFLGVYLICLMLIVPMLAKQNNRVALPLFGSGEIHLKPHTIFTSLAFRNYVKPELRDMIEEVTGQMAAEFPGVEVEYLDANYPLMKKFRMLPHLKHDNGKKLDVAYIYKKPSGGYSSRYFSFFGYGYNVKPLKGETNMPARCAEQGYWQYNILEKYVPDQKRRKLEFAVAENALLMRLLAEHPTNRFVILEPHLKERLGLENVDNIRALGCWAIRHDDHAHVQGY